MTGGATAPNGDADRGGSACTSFQGSLGEKDGGVALCGAETTRLAAVGLKVAALAFSIRGEAAGEPDEEYPDDEGRPVDWTEGDNPDSLRARPLVG